MKAMMRVVVLGLVLGCGTAVAAEPVRVQIVDLGSIEVQGAPAAERAARFFEKAEDLYLEYEAIEVRGTSEDQGKAIQKKWALLQEIDAVYDRVVSLQEEDWILAALAMRGILWADLARTLEEAPVPPDLLDGSEFDEETMDLYREQIESHAMRFGDAAAEIWEGAMERAWSNGLSGPWVEVIESLLRDAGVLCFPPRERAAEAL
ncbi:MAG: hypothetical protein ABIG68_02285 [Acidobacteriota bacterium]